MTTTLTPNESVLLRAILESPFNSDEGDEAVWSAELGDYCPLARTSIPGVMASLSKKGLVRTHGDGREATVKLTADGLLVALADRDGMAGDGNAACVPQD